MKKRIGSVMAAILGVCLFVVFSPTVRQSIGFTWMNRDSLARPRHYYFATRQWLADARTIMAAFRYLYESAVTNPLSPVELAKVPPSSPARPIAANFPGIDDAESSLLLVGHPLPRAERIIGRNRLSCLSGLPPMFVCAGFSSNGLCEMKLSALEAKSCLLEVRTVMRQQFPDCTNAPARSHQSHADPGASSIEGA
jgi:hypothetical protein